MRIAQITIVLSFLAASSSWGSDGNECKPKIKEGGVFSRNIPYSFYDQALESLPKLHPSFVLVASRRQGNVGATDYSLVAYKVSPSSDSVNIEGQAGSYELNKTWFFSLTVGSSQIANTMLCVLEHLSALTSSPTLKRDAAQKRSAP